MQTELRYDNYCKREEEGKYYCIDLMRGYRQER
jgi:hypothetical protein